MNELNSNREAWECKIGSTKGVVVPPGGDAPMRAAIKKAFREVTGEEAEAVFSGWASKFNKSEVAVIRNEPGIVLEEKPFDYIEEAHQTASGSFYGERISLNHFHEVIGRAVEALQELDVLKKAIFYGRGLSTASIPSGATLAELPKMVAGNGWNMNEEAAIFAIHGIIGKATEDGELLEMLSACINGDGFDKTNAREEVGDGLWYDALLLRAIGSNFDEAQRVNIAKLRHRFPDKFTEYDANNRDLVGERQILEGGQK